jgi:hypothetical protein
MGMKLLNNLVVKWKSHRDYKTEAYCLEKLYKQTQQ